MPFAQKGVQCATLDCLSIIQETVEVSKEVRWGHAHSVLEPRTDLALDCAGVDPFDLLHRSFLRGALISLKATIVPPDVTPDRYTDNWR